MDLEEKKVVKKLIKGYFLALGILILTLFFSQVFIQNSIKASKTDADVINISGRQRMLSQRICKSVLELYGNENRDNRLKQLNELVESLGLWEKSHAALKKGDKRGKLPGKNSYMVTETFEHIESNFQHISTSANEIVNIVMNEPYELEEISPYMEIILTNEGQFLEGMNTIVYQYEAEANRKNTRIKITGLLFFGAFLLVFALETVFVFRPALNYIKKAIKRIREGERLLSIEKKDLDSILNVNIDMLCVSNKEGYFEKVNDQFKEVLGYEKYELEGINYLDLVHDEDFPFTIKIMAEIEEGNTVSGFMNRFRCKDGTYKYIEWRSKQVGDRIYSSARDVTSSKLQEAELMTIATTDKLTNLYNRHYLYKVVGSHMEYSDRYDAPISALILDLDFFKRVNDTWGHPIGDEVLKMTAETMKKAIRETDLLVRFGGEEFLVLMPQTSADGAIIVAEKIRVAIENGNHPIAGKITASLGVAQRIKLESFRHWYYRVDKALYQAKETGRNRVIVSDKDEELEIGILLIEWKKQWESNNKIIDKQHRNILEMGNQLINLCIEATSQKEIEEQLDGLLKLISHHFSAEEEILKQVKYPGYAHHAEIHRKLLNKALKIKDLYHSGEVMPSAFYSFLMDDVIANHLEEEDTKFFGFLLAE